MFNDIRLPETDAWAAMARDLRQCKESRNALSKENSYVTFFLFGMAPGPQQQAYFPVLGNSSGDWQKWNPRGKSKSRFVFPSSSSPLTRRCNPKLTSKIVPDRWATLLRRHGLIS